MFQVPIYNAALELLNFYFTVVERALENTFFKLSLTDKFTSLMRNVMVKIFFYANLLY